MPSRQAYDPIQGYSNKSNVNVSTTRRLVVRAPRERSNLMPYLAQAAAMITALILFIFVFTNPLLTHGGALSNLAINVYIFCVTTIAQLLTSFIRSQLNNVWVREVDSLLEESSHSTHELHTLDQKWRTAMKVANLGERFKNIRIE